MQGKATIQLFDVVTGREVQRTEDKNLITNFYKNLFEVAMKNIHIKMMGYGPWTMLNALSPLEASKGVILFDTAQTESADTLLPTGGECLGHAGGDYSATDPFRGDYNASESGAITNGYNHVWDFATDKANGTIRSVCLTTQRGGDIGYKSNEWQAITVTAPVTDILSGLDLSTLAFSPTGIGTSSLLVGVAQAAADFYWQEGVSGTIKMHRSNKINFSAIAYSQASILAYKDFVQKTLGASEYLFLNFVGSTLYGLLYNSSTQEICLKTYDMSLTELTTLTLGTGHTMNYSTQRNTWGMVNNIIFVKSSTASVIDRDNATTGVYIDSITVSGITYVGQFSDDFIWLAKDSYNSGATYTYYLHDGTTQYGEICDKCDSSFDYGVNGIRIWYDDGIPTPFVLHQGRYYIKGGVWRPTFFSVNNLASPVTKTSSNTMKVTYQLTW